jgi:hypothetical protein
MRPAKDQPATNQSTSQTTDHSTDHRLTVPEAAMLLDLSEDAVRSRLKRGTLRKEKAQDGTVFVVLSANENTCRPSTNGTQASTNQITDNEQPITSQSTDQAPREEAALEPRESPETATEIADNSEGGANAEKPGERRSWLYRFFFGPT